MEKTSSPLTSPHCNNIGNAKYGVLFALMLTSGCASYVRINAPIDVAALQRPDHLTRFCVVECVLETHKNFAVMPGERSGLSTQKIDGLQPALQAVSPEWFSDDQQSIPLSMKITADVTGTGSGVGGAFTILFDLATPLQIAPGVWSDSLPVAARKESSMFSSPPSPETGWRKKGKSTAEMADTQANNMVALVSPIGQFALVDDLKSLDSPGGVDPHFAKILASLIVKTWNELSADEKHRLCINPSARKLKAILYPETQTAADSSNTGVAIPDATVAMKAFNAASTTPSVSGYGYVQSSRRGFVEFSKNGMEHLTALKWIHTTAIPKIVGGGVQIRILSEKTMGNGNSRIDFEVIQ